ncbi:MAG: recombinase family protein [Deltaproteobacteria bacterium]|nr:recombinase family protein [Deltaproteobacteria bacterium]
MSEAIRHSRAGLYHRVSTLDQDPQLASGEMYSAAHARGLEVLLDVAETGSGARNDRPGLQRVLGAARRGQVDTVIVWKLDRFGRSALDLLANIRILEDAGVRFISISQGLDVRPGGDPMSRLILVVLAGVAEFERELIGERTRLGLDKARRAGKRMGRPRGPRAPAPATVLLLRTQGLSWRAVARELACTVAAARRAAQRGQQGRAENGVGDPPSEVPESTGTE